MAVRDRDTRALREAEPGFRETGLLPTSIGQKYYLYEETLLCFQGIVEFDDKQCGSTIGRQEQMNVERGDCPGFTPWRRGYSPRDHREMLDREEERRWRQERDDADRKWRRRIEQDNRRWRLIELAVLGFGIILATIVGAFIERGSIP